MAIVSAISYFTIRDLTSFFLVASMGAASVLMYCAPNSPMATYRAFLLGNSVSALFGVTVSLIDLPIFVLAPVAVSGAIGVMHILRCQHPPGGATALVAIVGGEAVAKLGYFYALYPVGLNILIFFIFVYIQRKLLDNHRLTQWSESTINTITRNKMTNTSRQESVKEIQKAFGIELDVKVDELERILNYAFSQKKYRKGIHKNISELVNKNATTIEFGDTIQRAWQLMVRENTEYLVVLDKFNRVDGLIHMESILNLFNNLPKDVSHDFIETNLQISRAADKANMPESVGLILTPIKIVPHDAQLSSIIRKGHALPAVVVDEKQKFIGVIEEVI